MSSRYLYIQVLPNPCNSKSSNDGELYNRVRSCVSKQFDVFLRKMVMGMCFCNSGWFCVDLANGYVLPLIDRVFPSQALPRFPSYIDSAYVWCLDSNNWLWFVCSSPFALWQTYCLLGSNPTNIGMYAYIPEGITTNPGLIVALHYCTGSAQAFFNLSRYNTLADRKKSFMVLYGDAPAVGKCWDVASPASLTHDGGGDSLGIASVRIRQSQVSSPDGNVEWIAGRPFCNFQLERQSWQDLRDGNVLWFNDDQCQCLAPFQITPLVNEQQVLAGSYPGTFSSWHPCVR